MIKLRVELELNRAWIYENDEIAGETNFVVDINWFKELFEEDRDGKFKGYNSLEDFYLAYIPEEEGQYIYELAKSEGALLEDLGVNMY